MTANVVDRAQQQPILERCPTSVSRKNCDSRTIVECSAIPHLVNYMLGENAK